MIERIKLYKDSLYNKACELKKEALINNDEFNTFEEKLKSTKLTIAFVGQVKNGKTTLINSMFFRKNFLPVAATPMTASLCMIEYGEREEFEVEFYTQEEWNDIVKIATKSKEQEDEVLKGFRELVELSKRVGNELDRLLGKTKAVQPEIIHEYVGSDGKYTGITKSLKIKTPIEMFKHVIIVDTPGLNDPVRYREDRTLDFLSKADFVIVVLYAGRPFDEQDRELLVNRLSQSSAAKVAIVVNKIDTIWEEEGSLEIVQERINKYVKENLKDIKNEEVRSALSKAVTFPVSGLMALLGRMDIRDIRKDEDLTWYYDNYLKNLPVKSQKDIEANGQIDKVEDFLKETIENERGEILIRSPKSYLEGILRKRSEEIAIEQAKLKNLIKNMNLTQEEIKREKKSLAEVKEEILRGLQIPAEQSKVERLISESNYKKLIISGREECIREIGRIELDLIDLTGGYSKKINDIINRVIIESQKDIETDITELTKTLKQDLDKFLDKIDDICSPNISGAKIPYSYETYLRLKNILMESLRRDLGDLKLQLNISPIRTIRRFFIFGSDQNEAYNEAIKIVNSNFDELEKQSRKNINSIRDCYIGYLAKVEDEMRVKVFNPIIASMDELETRLLQQKKDAEDLEKGLKELDKKLHIIDNYLEDIRGESRI